MTAEMQKGDGHEAGTFTGIRHQRNSYESGKMQDSPAWYEAFIFLKIFIWLCWILVSVGVMLSLWFMPHATTDTQHS